MIDQAKAPALAHNQRPITGDEPVLITAENKPQVDAWRAYLAGNVWNLFDVMSNTQRDTFISLTEAWTQRTLSRRSASHEVIWKAYKRAELRAAYLILMRDEL